MTAWRDRVPAWVPRLVTVLAVGALVALSAWRRWQLLSASPFPVGIDGYFYPIQLRSLLETGHLQYPASPLTLWFMAPFAAATDPIVGAKLGACVGGALVAIPAYLLGARLGGGRGPGLVAAALATTSLGSTYLTVEFVKNGLGLAVALLAIWLVLRALDRRTTGRIAAAILGVVAAWLAHKMAAALVVLATLPAIVVAARDHRKLVVGLATAVGALALVVGLAAPRRFVSPDDLALIGGLWSGHARWDAPALATRHLTLTMDHEALAGLVAGLGVIALLVAHRRSPRLAAWLGTPPPAHVRATAWAIAGLAILIGLPWLAVDDPQGLGFRLRIAAYVPYALCLGMLARLVIGNLRALDGDALLLAIAIGLVGASPARTHVDGEVVPHPAMVSAVINARGKLPAGATAIVPERHIAFMVAWYTRAPVALRPEQARDRVYLLPLSFVGAGSALDDALVGARGVAGLAPPIGTHARHGNGLVIVPDATWRWVVDRLPPDERRRIDAWPTL
ncbi:MAG: glycosyltransferase family 39 protein [Proteobacteria bacterium]|nr:glycosyltransferase family 39 protein [Pseudomonadota bacterium]